MTTWGRNINGTLVDVVTVDPVTIYFPTLAEQYIVVPDGTIVGAMEENGVWVNPPPPLPPPPPPPPPPPDATPAISDSAKSLSIARVRTLAAQGRTNEALAALITHVESLS